MPTTTQRGRRPAWSCLHGRILHEGAVHHVTHISELYDTEQRVVVHLRRADGTGPSHGKRITVDRLSALELAPLA